MSEPLTSHEIEDVLSSIRRLVSEDLRPAARSFGGAAAAVPAPAGDDSAEAGKLLLTPALRVVVADRPPAVTAVAEETAVAPAPSPSVEALSVLTLADDGYDDQAWVEPEGADEGDGGLKALFDAAPPVASVAAAADGAVEDAADDDELLWSAPGDAVPDIAPDDVEIGEDLIAAPMRETHGHWTAQDVPGMDWAQEETDWVEPEPMPFVAHPRKTDVQSDPLARAWADRAEAEVRAKLQETVAAKAAAAAAAAEAAAVAEIRAPQSAGASAAAGLFDGDDTEIDEEMLRDIVRDIIREELAGALGERITRNVRKLVRVEINRALTAREFD